MTAPHVIFGRRVELLRKLHGWSQRELARRAGLSTLATVCRVESGYACSLDSAVAIAQALSITIDSMVMPPKCMQCMDLPPSGFICQACGAKAVSV